MVGTLRSTTGGACVYNETNGDCIPWGQWDLQVGDIIDFRFDLRATKDVEFYYAFIGA
jgi:hypothetical protein